MSDINYGEYTKPEVVEAEVAVEKKDYVDPYATVDTADAVYVAKTVSPTLYKALFTQSQKNFRDVNFIAAFEAISALEETGIKHAQRLVDLQLGSLKDAVLSELDNDFVAISTLLESIANRIETLPNR